MSVTGITGPHRLTRGRRGRLAGRALAWILEHPWSTSAQIAQGLGCPLSSLAGVLCHSVANGTLRRAHLACPDGVQRWSYASAGERLDQAPVYANTVAVARINEAYARETARAGLTDEQIEAEIRPLMEAAVARRFSKERTTQCA